MTGTVQRLPVTWAGDRDPKTHPRVGDRFSCYRYARIVLAFQSHSFGWWGSTAWEQCTHVQYGSRRSTSRMTKARWLEWVAAAEIVSLGPDPESPGKWVSRRTRCRKFSRSNRTAEFDWGSASWEPASSDTYELDLTIGNKTFGYKGLQGSDICPMELTLLALGIVTGAGIENFQERVALGEAWEEAWRRDIREVGAEEGKD